MIKKCLFGLLLLVASYTVNASNASTSPSLNALDSIVAIVNDTPILKSGLDQRIHEVKEQLESRHISLPADDILKSQILKQMIQEEVQLQLAASRHIEISSYQVNQQIQKIADEQKISIPDLYKEIEANGITREAYEKQIKDQMSIHELVQMTLASKINITPQDVDLYRHSQLAHATAGKEYQVANIVIPLNSNPTTEQIKVAEEKATHLLNDIRSGKVAFEQAALKNSSGQSNLQGGDLGFRSIAELPEIFADPVSNMQVGDVYGPLRAGNGIQLIKLLAIKNDQGDLSDEQIRQALFKRKLEEAYPLWLASLESQAYIQIID